MPRKKQRSSWGSLKSVGKTKHVLRYMANTPEGRTRKSVTFNCSRAQAELERDRLHVLHADKDDKPVPTIGKAYSMWYEPWLRRRVESGKAKERTVEIYTRCWDAYVEPRWARTPVSAVPPQQFQEWLLTLSLNNAKAALAVLRKIGDFSVKYECAQSNKFRIPYELPDISRPSKRQGTYSLAEADELFRALDGSPVKAPYILACFGSARTGESLGVRPEEVELVSSHGVELAVAPIVRRMGETGDAPLPDGDLKTLQSERALVIPEPYGTDLYAIAQQKIHEGVEWLADRGDGLPMSRSMLNHMWSKEAGRDALPFANLRTSWRTFAQYDWGVDYDTLEVLMGHKLKGVTGDHYLKPSVEQLINAVAKAVAQSRST